MVEGLCRGLLRNAAEAEDAAQQTFLSAYRALIGGTEPREPAAWLAAIARNECLARIRMRMREPLPVEAIESEDAREDPLAEALRRADLAALWAAIGELPQQQREALLLREFGGLSYEELAVALGVSGPAVESLLFRARTRVRAQLKEAFASVGWLSDVLARVLSAGGAAKVGSVPVVAKVVTAGVGVAVVAGTAVVGERRVTPSRPHRTQHATVQRPATPPQAAQPVGMAVVPAAATPIVRHVRATKPLQASADERSSGHQGPDGERAEANDQAEHRDQAAEHPPKEAGDRSGDAGEHGRHAASADEHGARNDVTFQTETGDQSGSDGSDHPGKSVSEPHGNSGSPHSDESVPLDATQVTDLLPHHGRGLPAGD